MMRKNDLRILKIDLDMLEIISEGLNVRIVFYH